MGWRGKAKHSLHTDVKCATIRRGYAGVVELVDSMDLGSIANRRAGSSPAARTKKGKTHIHVPLPFWYDEQEAAL